MIKRLVPLVGVALAVSTLVVGQPAHAKPKVFESTISIPGFDIANATAGGQAEGLDVPAALKRVCPGVGEFDGVWYRFFDLGAATGKNIKLTSQEPVVNQTVPNTPALDSFTQNEFDIDVYGFDAKCKRVEGPDIADGTSTTAKEQFRPKKPVRYLAVVYWIGPYPNLPFKLEVS